MISRGTVREMKSTLYTSSRSGAFSITWYTRKFRASAFPSYMNRRSMSGSDIVSLFVVSGWELKEGPGTTGRQYKSHERPLKVCADVFAIQVPGFRLIAMGGWQRIRINTQLYCSYIVTST